MSPIFRHAGAAFLGLMLAGSAYAATDDDPAIAKTLADMLRASRTVISNNQARINDPNLGDKGLTGQVVLAEAMKNFKASTGTDPMSIDAGSRQGRLLKAQMDSIAAVMDANQDTINAKGVGFKAFIPAVFGRLVNEEFAKRAQGEAEVKVTATRDLVRNRKALPDRWEEEVITQKLLAKDWPKGQTFSAVAELKGRPAFRVMVPEYYAASCLSCHGSPKGETDITGYPKEGRSENDLGGVISIALYR
jgi:Protein of unknown function (DUF3365)